jgi:hypothetical protein
MRTTTSSINFLAKTGYFGMVLSGEMEVYRPDTIARNPILVVRFFSTLH